MVKNLLNEIQAQTRLPRATYRLQLGPSFTFHQAAAIVPYLDELGISDIYVSPIFLPCSPESHGYDVCDHNQLNPALGSKEDFKNFVKSIQSKGMGLILDMVPNHMGIGGEKNVWWMDVLENGPSSPYANYFDIDWHPVKPELENKVLLPILEDLYGLVLENGKFRLSFEEGAFYIYYYDHKLPIAPRSYCLILNQVLTTLTNELPADHENLLELQSILTAISYLPPRTETSSEKIAERMREKEVIKKRLIALYQKSPVFRAALDNTVEDYNGEIGNPQSFEKMDTLLQDQAYRLCFWRVAADEINYRRFFDINHLAAIRMELPEVFQATHQLLFRLLAEGQVTGLRIDHPDGLWNPAHYLRNLQKYYLLFTIVRRLPAAINLPLEKIEALGEEWLANLETSPDRVIWPLFVVIEKILSEGEKLPRHWAIQGTTGYDFLNSLNSLFVARENQKTFDRLYTHFIGQQIDLPNLINSNKKMIMLISLASEIASLSHQLERLSEKNRWYRDFTLNSLTFALREVIACLPIYRTYITGPDAVSERDAAYLTAAVEEAKRRNPRTAGAIFDFIRDTLLLRNLANFSPEDWPKILNFVMRFQQITGPVMAKGLEDTAFYIYNRLISLNEVGGHPEKFGLPVEEFHNQNIERLHHWPLSLIATSTHDTKRSEDVRGRLNILSEMPAEWKRAVHRWRRWNASKKTLVDGQLAPDPNDEYHLYQTLVGAWPLEDKDDDFLQDEEFSKWRERITTYMHKAILEAKVHTSWFNPNREYEKAMQSFIYGILQPERKNKFLADLRSFQKRVAYFGLWNSLGQVILKLTSPGIPDFYQGTELWNFSLVDPDNRRPVDYQKRKTLLAELKMKLAKLGNGLLPLAQELLQSSWDGRIKLFIIYSLLNYRQRNSALFRQGDYLPLLGEGEKKEHVVAFARRWANLLIIVVTPRLMFKLTGGIEKPPLGLEIWKDTRIYLPAEEVSSSFFHLFTGETIAGQKEGEQPYLSLATILKNFPVAVLERIRPKC
ncbi:MAG: malto-oligosyltrehalose synthase [Thermodesulfobacteriota bacterium]